MRVRNNTLRPRSCLLAAALAALWSLSLTVFSTPALRQHEVEVRLMPVSQDELYKFLPNDIACAKVYATRLEIKNTTDRPAKILWGDFFARASSGNWVGGWWNEGKPSAPSLRRSLDPQSPPSTLPLEVPPHSSMSHVMVDPWVMDSSEMEYRFECLAWLEGSGLVRASSVPQTSPPLEVSRSGVEMVLAGVSSALKSVVEEPDDATAAAMPAVGPGLELKPIGQVEIQKHESLPGEIRKWVASGKAFPEKIYAYQLEVSNNTLQDLQLAQLSVRTSHSGKWLSGALKDPLVLSEEILEKGYLQTASPGSMPRLKKMENLWIPPGARAVLPLMWHPASTDSSATITPTPARWDAVLVDRSGNPFSASAQTDSEMCPVDTPRH